MEGIACRRRGGVLLLLLLGLLLVRGEAWGAGSVERFAHANELYNRAQYDSAAMEYEALVGEAGVVSEHLYYNLGNAYYRQGQYARAILSYERALKHNPSYEDAQFNLGLARLHVTDKFAGEGSSVLERSAHRIYTLLAPRSWGWLSLSMLGVVLVAVLLFRFTRVRRLIPLAVFMAVSAFVLAIVSFVVGRKSEYYLLHSGQAIIMQSVVSVKSEPGETSKDLFLLHSGSKVRLVMHLGEWVEIAIPDGHRGWVESRLVEEI